MTLWEGYLTQLLVPSDQNLKGKVYIHVHLVYDVILVVCIKCDYSRKIFGPHNSCYDAFRLFVQCAMSSALLKTVYDWMDLCPGDFASIRVSWEEEEARRSQCTPRTTSISVTLLHWMAWPVVWSISFELWLSLEDEGEGRSVWLQYGVQYLAHHSL